MVVIMKFVYVLVLFISLLLTVNVNAIQCETDEDCKGLYVPSPGYAIKCIEGECLSQKI
uniref:Late nodulin-like protein n=1 Tax=Astragalus sinicus TaxID=47065 RepID=Q07A33_ASTSI|nr:late nodulin-like protein [Astragalus sinicus]